MGLSKSKPEIPATDITSLKESLGRQDHNYPWLGMQASLSYDDGSNNATANLSLRNRKDSVIWASANLLIEAVRILINKDSATLLNRLQKNYSVFPVSDLSKILGIDNLDIKSVQNTLQGIPPFGINDKSTFESKDGKYLISNQQATYKETYVLSAKTLKMTEYRYERNASEYVEFHYSNYKLTANQWLPNKIEADVHSQDKIHIILDVTDYSIQATDEVPFSIPQSYTKIN